MRRARAAFFLSLALLLYCAAGHDIPAPQTGGQAAFPLEKRRENWRVLRELDRIIEDGEAGDELRGLAREKKLELLCRMEQEAALEGLLSNLGYPACTASVRKGGVYLAIPAFRQEDAARVLEMAVRETGQPPGAVRILPVP